MGGITCRGGPCRVLGSVVGVHYHGRKVARGHRCKRVFCHGVLVVRLRGRARAAVGVGYVSMALLLRAGSRGYCCIDVCCSRVEDTTCA